MTDIHLPTFKTKRLTLRHLTDDDFSFMREMDTNLEVIKYINHGDPKTEEETTRTMQKIFANYETFEMGMMIVEDSLSGEKLGRAGLFPKNTEFGLVWEIGFAFMPSAWGKGYATEVSTYLMNWGIENLVTDFIVMVIQQANLNSIHVAEKIGMNHWRDEQIDGVDYFIYRTL
jgi:ribosomal-protein-alanine N-acetyltransferase